MEIKREERFSTEKYAIYSVYDNNDELVSTDIEIKDEKRTVSLEAGSELSIQLGDHISDFLQERMLKSIRERDMDTIVIDRIIKDLISEFEANPEKGQFQLSAEAKEFIEQMQRLSEDFEERPNELSQVD